MKMRHSISAQPSSDSSLVRSQRAGLLLCVMLVWFTSYFVRLAWPNVATGAAKSIGTTATALGAIITSFYIGYVIANVAGGFIVDRFGPRRVIGIALATLATATYLFGSVSTPTQGYAIQVVMGLSAGSLYAALVKLVAAWYPAEERGSAYGLMFLAGPLSIVAANLIYPLFLSVANWSLLYKSLGVFGAIVALVTTTFIRDVPIKMSAASAFEGSIGRRIPDIEPSTSYAVLLLCVIGFGAGWGTYGFTFCSNLLMVRGHGFAAADAAKVALLFGLGGLCSIPVYGRISDRLALHRPALIIGGFLFLVFAMGLFALQNSFLGFCLSGFVLGVAAYAYLPLLSAVLSETVGQRSLGKAAGFTNASTQLAIVAVPLAVGQILDRTGSLALSVLTLAAGPGLGILATSLLVASRRHALS